jgi:hypothetical protein
MLSTREPHFSQPTGADGPVPPVVVAVALRRSARELEDMQEALGAGFIVEDIRTAPAEAAVVVVPPCSPGAIKAILHAFPSAQVVVVEGEATARVGPVERVLLAGAVDYVRTLTAGGFTDAVRSALSRLNLKRPVPARLAG